MEVLITIMLAVLSGLAFIIYKKPEIAFSLLHRAFYIWGIICFCVLFSFKLNSFELQSVIRSIEGLSTESVMDKFGADKSIKIIRDKIDSYERLYVILFSSVFIFAAGLIGLYFFSTFMLAHKKEANKAEDETV